MRPRRGPTLLRVMTLALLYVLALAAIGTMGEGPEDLLQTSPRKEIELPVVGEDDDNQNNQNQNQNDADRSAESIENTNTAAPEEGGLSEFEQLVESVQPTEIKTPDVAATPKLMKTAAASASASGAKKSYSSASKERATGKAPSKIPTSAITFPSASAASRKLLVTIPANATGAGCGLRHLFVDCSVGYIHVQRAIGAQPEMSFRFRCCNHHASQQYCTVGRGTNADNNAAIALSYTQYCCSKNPNERHVQIPLYAPAPPCPALSPASCSTFSGSCDGSDVVDPNQSCSGSTCHLGDKARCCRAPAQCNTYTGGCPTGKIKVATNTCLGTACQNTGDVDKNRCCVTSCSTFSSCPATRYSVAARPCPTGTCDQATCCADKASCSSFGGTCNSATTIRDTSRKCSTGTCHDTNDLGSCCVNKQTCDVYPVSCGDGYARKSNLASITCAGSSCTKTECCNQRTPCNSGISCPSGQYSDTTKTYTGTSTQQCCQPHPTYRCDQTAGHAAAGFVSDKNLDDFAGCCPAAHMRAAHKKWTYDRTQNKDKAAEAYTAACCGTGETQTTYLAFQTNMKTKDRGNRAYCFPKSTTISARQAAKSCGTTKCGTASQYTGLMDKPGANPSESCSSENDCRKKCCATKCSTLTACPSGSAPLPSTPCPAVVDEHYGHVCKNTTVHLSLCCKPKQDPLQKGNTVSCSGPATPLPDDAEITLPETVFNDVGNTRKSKFTGRGLCRSNGAPVNLIEGQFNFKVGDPTQFKMKRCMTQGTSSTDFVVDETEVDMNTLLNIRRFPRASKPRTHSANPEIIVTGDQQGNWAAKSCDSIFAGANKDHIACKFCSGTDCSSLTNSNFCAKRTNNMAPNQGKQSRNAADDANLGAGKKLVAIQCGVDASGLSGNYSSLIGEYTVAVKQQLYPFTAQDVAVTLSRPSPTASNPVTFTAFAASPDSNKYQRLCGGIGKCTVKVALRSSACGSSVTEALTATGSFATLGSKLNLCAQTSANDASKRVMSDGSVRSGQTADKVKAKIRCHTANHTDKIVTWETGPNDAVRVANGKYYLKKDKDTPTTQTAAIITAPGNLNKVKRYVSSNGPMGSAAGEGGQKFNPPTITVIDDFDNATLRDNKYRDIVYGCGTQTLPALHLDVAAPILAPRTSSVTHDYGVQGSVTIAVSYPSTGERSGLSGTRLSPDQGTPQTISMSRTTDTASHIINVQANTTCRGNNVVRVTGKAVRSGEGITHESATTITFKSKQRNPTFGDTTGFDKAFVNSATNMNGPDKVGKGTVKVAFAYCDRTATASGCTKQTAKDELADSRLADLCAPSPPVSYTERGFTVVVKDGTTSFIEPKAGTKQWVAKKSQICAYSGTSDACEHRAKGNPVDQGNAALEVKTLGKPQTTAGQILGSFQKLTFNRTSGTGDDSEATSYIIEHYRPSNPMEYRKVSNAASFGQAQTSDLQNSVTLSDFVNAPPGSATFVRVRARHTKPDGNGQLDGTWQTAHIFKAGKWANTVTGVQPATVRASKTASSLQTSKTTVTVSAPDMNAKPCVIAEFADDAEVRLGAYASLRAGTGVTNATNLNATLHDETTAQRYAAQVEKVTSRHRIPKGPYVVGIAGLSSAENCTDVGGTGTETEVIGAHNTKIHICTFVNPPRLKGSSSIAVQMNACTGTSISTPNGRFDCLLNDWPSASETYSVARSGRSCPSGFDASGTVVVGGNLVPRCIGNPGAKQYQRSIDHDECQFDETAVPPSLDYAVMVPRDTRIGSSKLSDDALCKGVLGGNFKDVRIMKSDGGTEFVVCMGSGFSNMRGAHFGSSPATDLPDDIKENGGIVFAVKQGVACGDGAVSMSDTLSHISFDDTTDKLKLCRAFSLRGREGDHMLMVPTQYAGLDRELKSPEVIETPRQLAGCPVGMSGAGVIMPASGRLLKSDGSVVDKHTGDYDCTSGECFGAIQLCFGKPASPLAACRAIGDRKQVRKICGIDATNVEQSDSTVTVDVGGKLEGSTKVTVCAVDSSATSCSGAPAEAKRNATITIERGPAGDLVQPSITKHSSVGGKTTLALDFSGADALGGCFDSYRITLKAGGNPIDGTLGHGHCSYYAHAGRRSGHAPSTETITVGDPQGQGVASFVAHRSNDTLSQVTALNVPNATSPDAPVVAVESNTANGMLYPSKTVAEDNVRTGGAFQYKFSLTNMSLPAASASSYKFTVKASPTNDVGVAILCPGVAATVSSGSQASCTLSPADFYGAGSKVSALLYEKTLGTAITSSIKLEWAVHAASASASSFQAVSGNAAVPFAPITYVPPTVSKIEWCNALHYPLRTDETTDYCCVQATFAPGSQGRQTHVSWTKAELVKSDNTAVDFAASTTTTMDRKNGQVRGWFKCNAGDTMKLKLSFRWKPSSSSSAATTKTTILASETLGYANLSARTQNVLNRSPPLSYVQLPWSSTDSAYPDLQLTGLVLPRAVAVFSLPNNGTRLNQATVIATASNPGIKVYSKTRGVTVRGVRFQCATGSSSCKGLQMVDENTRPAPTSGSDSFCTNGDCNHGLTCKSSSNAVAQCSAAVSSFTMPENFVLTPSSIGTVDSMDHDFALVTSKASAGDCFGKRLCATASRLTCVDYDSECPMLKRSTDAPSAKPQTACDTQQQCANLPGVCRPADNSRNSCNPTQICVKDETRCNDGSCTGGNAQTACSSGKGTGIFVGACMFVGSVTIDSVALDQVKTAKLQVSSSVNASTFFTGAGASPKLCKLDGCTAACSGSVFCKTNKEIELSTIILGGLKSSSTGKHPKVKTSGVTVTGSESGLTGRMIVSRFSLALCANEDCSGSPSPITVDSANALDYTLKSTVMDCNKLSVLYKSGTAFLAFEGGKAGQAQSVQSVGCKFTLTGAAATTGGRRLLSSPAQVTTIVATAPSVGLFGTDTCGNGRMDGGAVSYTTDSEGRRVTECKAMATAKENADRVAQSETCDIASTDQQTACCRSKGGCVGGNTNKPFIEEGSNKIYAASNPNIGSGNGGDPMGLASAITSVPSIYADDAATVNADVRWMSRLRANSTIAQGVQGAVLTDYQHKWTGGHCNLFHPTMADGDNKAARCCKADGSQVGRPNYLDVFRQTTTFDREDYDCQLFPTVDFASDTVSKQECHSARTGLGGGCFSTLAEARGMDPNYPTMDKASGNLIFNNRQHCDPTLPGGCSYNASHPAMISNFRKMETRSTSKFVLTCRNSDQEAAYPNPTTKVQIDNQKYDTAPCWSSDVQNRQPPTSSLQPAQQAWRKIAPECARFGARAHSCTDAIESDLLLFYMAPKGYCIRQNETAATGVCHCASDPNDPTALPITDDAQRQNPIVGCSTHADCKGRCTKDRVRITKHNMDVVMPDNAKRNPSVSNSKGRGEDGQWSYTFRQINYHQNPLWCPLYSDKDSGASPRWENEPTHVYDIAGHAGCLDDDEILTTTNFANKSAAAAARCERTRPRPYDPRIRTEPDIFKNGTSGQLWYEDAYKIPMHGPKAGVGYCGKEIVVDHMEDLHGSLVFEAGMHIVQDTSSVAMPNSHWEYAVSRKFCFHVNAKPKPVSLKALSELKAGAQMRENTVSTEFVKSDIASNAQHGFTLGRHSSSERLGIVLYDGTKAGFTESEQDIDAFRYTLAFLEQKQKKQANNTYTQLNYHPTGFGVAENETRFYEVPAASGKDYTASFDAYNIDSMLQRLVMIPRTLDAGEIDSFANSSFFATHATTGMADFNRTGLSSTIGNWHADLSTYGTTVDGGIVAGNDNQYAAAMLPELKMFLVTWEPSNCRRVVANGATQIATIKLPVRPQFYTGRVTQPGHQYRPSITVSQQREVREDYAINSNLTLSWKSQEDDSETWYYAYVKLCDTTRSSGDKVDISNFNADLDGYANVFDPIGKTPCGSGNLGKDCGPAHKNLAGVNTPTSQLYRFNVRTINGQKAKCWYFFPSKAISDLYTIANEGDEQLTSAAAATCGTTSTTEPSVDPCDPQPRYVATTTHGNMLHGMKTDTGATMNITQKQHVLAHARTTDWMKDILLRPFANIITWPHAEFSVTIADFARQWPRDQNERHLVRYTTPVADMHFLVLPRPEQKFTFQYCPKKSDGNPDLSNCESDVAQTPKGAVRRPVDHKEAMPISHLFEDGQAQPLDFSVRTSIQLALNANTKGVCRSGTRRSSSGLAAVLPKNTDLAAGNEQYAVWNTDADTKACVFSPTAKAGANNECHNIGECVVNGHLQDTAVITMATIQHFTDSVASGQRRDGSTDVEGPGICMPQGNPMTSRNNSAVPSISPLYTPKDWLKLKDYTFCNGQTTGINRKDATNCKSRLVEEGTDNEAYFSMTDYWDLINSVTEAAARSGVDKIPLITNAIAQFSFDLDFNTVRQKSVATGNFKPNATHDLKSCAQFYAGSPLTGYSSSRFLDLVQLRFHVGQTEMNTNMDAAFNKSLYYTAGTSVLLPKQMYAVQTALTDVGIYVEPKVDHFDTSRALLTADAQRMPTTGVARWDDDLSEYHTYASDQTIQGSSKSLNETRWILESNLRYCEATDIALTNNRNGKKNSIGVTQCAPGTVDALSKDYGYQLDVPYAKSRDTTRPLRGSGFGVQHQCLDLSFLRWEDQGIFSDTAPLSVTIAYKRNSDATYPTSQNTLVTEDLTLWYVSDDVGDLTSASPPHLSKSTAPIRVQWGMERDGDPDWDKGDFPRNPNASAFFELIDEVSAFGNAAAQYGKANYTKKLGKRTFGLRNFYVCGQQERYTWDQSDSLFNIRACANQWNRDKDEIVGAKILNNQRQASDDAQDRSYCQDFYLRVLPVSKEPVMQYFSPTTKNWHTVRSKTQAERTIDYVMSDAGKHETNNAFSGRVGQDAYTIVEDELYPLRIAAYDGNLGSTDETTTEHVFVEISSVPCTGDKDRASGEFLCLTESFHAYGKPQKSGDAWKQTGTYDIDESIGGDDFRLYIKPRPGPTGHTGTEHALVPDLKQVKPCKSASGGASRLVDPRDCYAFAGGDNVKTGWSRTIETAERNIVEQADVLVDPTEGAIRPLNDTNPSLGYAVDPLAGDRFVIKCSTASCHELRTLFIRTAPFVSRNLRLFVRAFTVDDYAFGDRMNAYKVRSNYDNRRKVFPMDTPATAITPSGLRAVPSAIVSVNNGILLAKYKKCESGSYLGCTLGMELSFLVKAREHRARYAFGAYDRHISAGLNSRDYDARVWGSIGNPSTSVTAQMRVVTQWEANDNTTGLEVEVCPPQEGFLSGQYAKLQVHPATFAEMIECSQGASMGTSSQPGIFGRGARGQCSGSSMDLVWAQYGPSRYLHNATTNEYRDTGSEPSYTNAFETANGAVPDAAKLNAIHDLFFLESEDANEAVQGSSRDSTAEGKCRPGPVRVAQCPEKHVQMKDQNGHFVCRRTWAATGETVSGWTLDAVDGKQTANMFAKRQSEAADGVGEGTCNRLVWYGAKDRGCKRLKIKIATARDYFSPQQTKYNGVAWPHIRDYSRKTAPAPMRRWTMVLLPSDSHAPNIVDYENNALDLYVGSSVSVHATKLITSVGYRASTSSGVPSQSCTGGSRGESAVSAWSDDQAWSDLITDNAKLAMCACTSAECQADGQAARLNVTHNCEASYTVCSKATGGSGCRDAVEQCKHPGFVSYTEGIGDNFVRMAHTHYAEDHSKGNWSDPAKLPDSLYSGINQVAVGKGMVIGTVNYARTDDDRYQGTDWEYNATSGHGRCLKQREAFDVVVNFFIKANDDVDTEDVTIFRASFPKAAADIDARRMSVRIEEEKYIDGGKKVDFLTKEIAADAAAYAATKDAYVKPICAMSESNNCVNAKGDRQSGICGACRFRFPKLSNSDRSSGTQVCSTSSNWRKALQKSSFEAQWLTIHLNNEKCGSSSTQSPFKQMETWIDGIALTAFPGKLMLYPELLDDPFLGGKSVRAIDSDQGDTALYGNALYAASMTSDALDSKRFKYGFATKQVAALRLINDDDKTDQGFVQLRGLQRVADSKYLLPQYPMHHPFGDGSAAAPPGTNGAAPSRCSASSTMTVPVAEANCDVVISETKAIDGQWYENRFVFGVARSGAKCTSTATAVVTIENPYSKAEPEMSMKRREPCPGSTTHSSQCKALNADGTQGTCYCCSLADQKARYCTNVGFCATNWSPATADAIAYKAKLPNRDCRAGVDSQCGATSAYSCYTPNFGKITAGWEMSTYTDQATAGNCRILNRYYKTGSCVASGKSAATFNQAKLPCATDAHCRTLGADFQCSNAFSYPSLWDSQVQESGTSSSRRLLKIQQHSNTPVARIASGGATQTNSARSKCRQGLFVAAKTPKAPSNGECGNLMHYICHGVGIPNFAPMIRNGQQVSGGRCENDGSACGGDSDCNLVFASQVPNSHRSDKSKYEPVAALCEWADNECNSGDTTSSDVKLLSLRIIEDGVRAMSGRSFGKVQLSTPETAATFVQTNSSAVPTEAALQGTKPLQGGFCTQIPSSSSAFGVVVEDSDTVIRKDDSAPVTTDTMDARNAFSDIVAATNGETLRTGALKFSATATLNLKDGCNGYVGGSCEPNLNMFYVRSPGKTTDSLKIGFDGDADVFNTNDKTAQHPFQGFATCSSMADNLAMRVKNSATSYGALGLFKNTSTALLAFNTLFGANPRQPTVAEWKQYNSAIVPYSSTARYTVNFGDTAEANVANILHNCPGAADYAANYPMTCPGLLYDLKAEVCKKEASSGTTPTICADSSHQGYTKVNRIGGLGNDECDSTRAGTCTTGGAACYGDNDCVGTGPCYFPYYVDWYCETKPVTAGSLQEEMITTASIKCKNKDGSSTGNTCPTNALFTGACKEATTCMQNKNVACTDKVLGPAKCQRKPFYFNRKWFANSADEQAYAGAASWDQAMSTSYPASATQFSFAALEYEFDTTLDKLTKCRNADGTPAVKVTTEGTNTKYEFEQCATTLTARPRLNYEQDATDMAEAQYEGVTACRSYGIVMNRITGFTTGVTMSQPTLAFIYKVELVDATHAECVADWNWATGQGGSYAGKPMAKLHQNQTDSGAIFTGFGPNNTCSQSDADAGLVKRLKITVHIESQDINKDYLVFPSQYPHANYTCPNKNECYDKAKMETNLIAQMRVGDYHLDNCYGLMNYDPTAKDANGLTKTSTFRHEPTFGSSGGGQGAMGRTGYTRTTGEMYTAAINTKGAEDAFMKCVASGGSVPSHSTNFDFGTAEGKKLLTRGQVQRQEKNQEAKTLPDAWAVGDFARDPADRSHGYALWKCKQRNAQGVLASDGCNQGSTTFAASLDIARTVTITPATTQSSVLTEVRFFSSPYNSNPGQRNEIVPELNAEDQNYKATVSDKYDVAIMASVKYRYDVCDTGSGRCMLGRAHACTSDAQCNGGGENNGWYKNLALAVDKVVFATMKKCCYDPMINVRDVSAAPLSKPKCDAVSTDEYSPLSCVVQGLDPTGPYHCEGSQVPKLNELDEAGWYRFLVSERVKREKSNNVKYASKFNLGNKLCRSLPSSAASDSASRCPAALLDVGLSSGCWGAANRLYFMNDHMVAIEHGTITDVANATYGTCEGVYIGENDGKLETPEVQAIPDAHKGICTCKGMNARRKGICPNGQFESRATCLDRKVIYANHTDQDFLETCGMSLDFAESQNMFSATDAQYGSASATYKKYEALLGADGITAANHQASYKGTFQNKKSFDAVILPASKFPYGMMMYMEITMKLMSIDSTGAADAGLRRLLSWPSSQRTTLVERVYGKGATMQSDGSILVKSGGFVNGAGGDQLAQQLDRGIPVGVMPTLFPSLEVVPDDNGGIVTGYASPGVHDDGGMDAWLVFLIIHCCFNGLILLYCLFLFCTTYDGENPEIQAQNRRAFWAYGPWYTVDRFFQDQCCCLNQLSGVFTFITFLAFGWLILLIAFVGACFGKGWCKALAKPGETEKGDGNKPGEKHAASFPPSYVTHDRTYRMVASAPSGLAYHSVAKEEPEEDFHL